MSNRLYLKSLVLATLLVETFDELEQEIGYKHQLKLKGNQFKKELEKYVDNVFDNSDEIMVHTEYINRVSKELDKTLEI